MSPRMTMSRRDRKTLIADARDQWGIEPGEHEIITTLLAKLVGESGDTVQAELAHLADSADLTDCDECHGERFTTKLMPQHKHPSGFRFYLGIECCPYCWTDFGGGVLLGGKQ